MEAIELTTGKEMLLELKVPLPPFESSIFTWEQLADITKSR